MSLTRHSIHQVKAEDYTFFITNYFQWHPIHQFKAEETIHFIFDVYRDVAEDFLYIMVLKRTQVVSRLSILYSRYKKSAIKTIDYDGKRAATDLIFILFIVIAIIS